MKTLDNYEYYKEHWEDTAQYLEKSAGVRWNKHMITWMLKHIEHNEIKQIYDLGCGAGNKTYFLAKLFPNANVVGFDFSDAGIDEARKNYRLPNLKYEVKDITRMSCEEAESVDLVTLFDVLEHIENDKDCLNTFLNSAKPKYIMICVPTGKMYSSGIHSGHFRHYSKKGLEIILNQFNYTPIKTTEAGFPFVSPIFRDLSMLMSRKYESFYGSEIKGFASIINGIWYFLFRFLSSKRFGSEFFGVFKRSKL